MKLSHWVWLSGLLLVGCATSRPAPVIERGPQIKKAEPAKKPATVQPAEKDWRPEVYTVKKGDTLHSIGLEYGYDYKEIAQANNIQPPYVIHIGEQLKIKSAEAKPATTVNDNKGANDTNVVITPLGGEPGVAGQPAGIAPQPTGETPLLKEPKALREPYSTQALAAATNQPKTAADATANKAVDTVKPETTKPDTAKPADNTKPEAAKPEATSDDDESMDWGWPAGGKVIAGFDDANSAKGIDIAGTQGQAVLAAAPGKVIYSGTDLRGYGKLIIIKHNKTYLSVYAHNSQILVKEGQQVNKGQKIAEMGSSDADRVKLHFEIRRQGKSVDPEKYLSGKKN